MKILFLSYYFEPDLCAGSFRNTSLFKELLPLLTNNDELDVVTTQPNRYNSYNVNANELEVLKRNIIINRINIPLQKNGMLGQIKSFKKFYFDSLKLVSNKEYDIVYASSSRLFTAFLGARIANKKKAKLYLDIRDIFRETILDIYKNPLIRFGLNSLLTPIESYTFKRANHINLISKGFISYFEKYQNTYTFFTNGIDAVFLNSKTDHKAEKEEEKKLKTIFYGGNIGEGQGLDLIIPAVAQSLKGKYNFLVIGDGGAKEKLINILVKKNIKNVKILPPVSRSQLIMEYNKADYLFLHLNKHKAFERVLPSKLFEYATFPKPIIAGVAGYAKLFLENNMENTIIFEPCNADELLTKLNQYEYTQIDREEFKNKFSRKKINEEMAKTIISL